MWVFGLGRTHWSNFAPLTSLSSFGIILFQSLYLLCVVAGAWRSDCGRWCRSVRTAGTIGGRRWRRSTSWSTAAAARNHADSSSSSNRSWSWPVSAGHCHWRRRSRRRRQWRRGGRSPRGHCSSLDSLRMKRKMMMMAGTGCAGRSAPAARAIAVAARSRINEQRLHQLRAAGGWVPRRQRGTATAAADAVAGRSTGPSWRDGRRWRRRLF